MTINPQDRVVGTIIMDHKGRPKLVEGKESPTHRLHFHITEAQLLTLNSFVRKRWEKTLEGSKVPYTTPPSPPPTDQTF